MKHPLYHNWYGLKKRCYNKNCKAYKYYGGRGITVCDRWKDSFQNFCDDMGPKPTPKHSIDRINNDGNYEPENCRWATIQEQNNNKNSNHIIEYKGKEKTLKQWSEQLGIRYGILMNRYFDGINNDKLFEPIKFKNNVINYLGKSKTLAQWCKELNLKYNNICKRWSRGITDPEELFAPKQFPINYSQNSKICNFITHNGITLNLKQWANKYNLNYSTVKFRFSKGIRDFNRLFAPVKSKNQK